MPQSKKNTPHGMLGRDHTRSRHSRHSSIPHRSFNPGGIQGSVQKSVPINSGKDLMSDAESRQRIQGANRTGNKRVKQRKGVVAIPTPISRKRPGNAQGLMSAKNVKNKKRKK